MSVMMMPGKHNSDRSNVFVKDYTGVYIQSCIELLTFMLLQQGWKTC